MLKTVDLINLLIQQKQGISWLDVQLKSYQRKAPLHEEIRLVSRAGHWPAIDRLM